MANHYTAEITNPESKNMTTDHPVVSKQRPVRYHTICVNKLDVFYREAGPPNAPVILLFHGFPTSSNMFRHLIPLLATSFRVVAPDYPGFGQSRMPSHNDFDDSFENLTNVMEALVDKLGLTRYSIYVMDYGAPIGYRLALRHPERVQALIVQNGNACDEGEFGVAADGFWSTPGHLGENRADRKSIARRSQRGELRMATDCFW
jgi:pimeloyl-ACP methyl ester carboxylesterase